MIGLAASRAGGQRASLKVNIDQAAKIAGKIIENYFLKNDAAD